MPCARSWGTGRFAHRLPRRAMLRRVAAPHNLARALGPVIFRCCRGVPRRVPAMWWSSVRCPPMRACPLSRRLSALPCHACPWEGPARAALEGPAVGSVPPALAAAPDPDGPVAKDDMPEDDIGNRFPARRMIDGSSLEGLAIACKASAVNRFISRHIYVRCRSRVAGGAPLDPPFAAKAATAAR